MKTSRACVTYGVCLYVFAVLQQAVPERIAIIGARPDFLLLLSITFALLVPRRWGVVVGGVAGLVHGGLAGVSIAAYISSRSLAGFCASWSKDLRYEMNAPAVIVATMVMTLIGELSWLLISPQPGIGAFLGATIGTAVYNGVLAAPLYALLKRVVDPPRR